MSGLYVHIPFCRVKCGYCNFFSLATTRHRDELIAALIKESAWQKDYPAFNSVDTLYLGGGTPSLLTQKQMGLLFDALLKDFHIESGAEISLECNPDDVTKENLAFWKDLGINRLSIGIQSFRPQDLTYLDRTHDANQALISLNLVQIAGFENLSIDLIYGIPEQSLRAWEENLNMAIQRNIPHISAYALTIENKTILKASIDKGLKPGPNDDLVSAHFFLLHDMLSMAGYDHYEISNLALPSRIARHNTSYWNGIPYLGLGPSAHSYDGFIRWWNKSLLTPYIQAKNLGDMRESEEVLRPLDRYNEYLMTGLRTKWGCKVDDLLSLGSPLILENFNRQAEHYKDRGLMEHHESSWCLTTQGMILSDTIISSFFIEQDFPGFSAEA